MLDVYVHGVTDELAAALIEPADIPVLRRLLRDARFPRRDNVVAFLAHSDSGTATADLIATLASPPADATVPEEDRALLLTPQALGRIAGRGDASALEALLEITSGADDAEPLVGASRRSIDPEAMRADLLEASLRGLAFTRSPRARARLEEVALGRLRLDM